MFAILPGNVETDRSIKNLNDIFRHIKKTQLAQNKLFNIIIIFENVFKQSFYTLLKISGLFANIPENLDTARSMKNMTVFFVFFYPAT